MVAGETGDSASMKDQEVSGGGRLTCFGHPRGDEPVKTGRSTLSIKHGFLNLLVNVVIIVVSSIAG